MIKVLFVCLGNICRSPMAQFVFKQMVNERGLSDKFEIDSAATEKFNEFFHAGIHKGTRKKLIEMKRKKFKNLEIKMSLKILICTR